MYLKTLKLNDLKNSEECCSFMGEKFLAVGERVAVWKLNGDDTCSEVNQNLLRFFIIIAIINQNTLFCLPGPEFQARHLNSCHRPLGRY